MAVLYNGIRFESVQELIEYQQYERGKSRPKDEEAHTAAFKGDNVFFRRASKWTRKEDSILRLMSKDKSCKEIAEAMNKTYSAVYRRQINLGIAKFQHKKHFWTKEQEAALEKGLADKCSLKQLAKLTGRSKRSCYMKIYNDNKAQMKDVSGSKEWHQSAFQKKKSQIRMKWIHGKAKELLPKFNNDFNKAFLAASEQWRTKLGKVSEEKPVAQKLGLTTFGLDSLKKLLPNGGSVVGYKAAAVSLERADREQWNAIEWIDFCKRIVTNGKDIKDEFGFGIQVIMQGKDYLLARS
jgi:predicted DNA-binding protein YlxM (UPF0122 family)